MFQIKCCQCGKDKHIEFDIGWELVCTLKAAHKKPEFNENDIFICPDCIMKFEAVKMKFEEIIKALPTRTKENFSYSSMVDMAFVDGFEYCLKEVKKIIDTLSL